MGEEENPRLNELVRLLEEELDDDGVEDVADHRAPHGVEHEVVVPVSPRAGAQSVRRYLSSSSAKRRAQKLEHCNFCHLHLDKSNLEDHLNTSDSCQILYLRRAHLKTVPAVMVHAFGCLYCDEPFSKLQVHLRSSPNCARQYFARFGVETVE